MEDTVTILQTSASQKNIELLLNLQPNLPRTVVLDEIRLRQVLINLVGNAIKFTKRGEVEIYVRFTPDRIRAGMGKFTFSVRDTGIGNSEESSKKLFQKFSQADASTTKQYGGTGLGLVIANSLVHKMGGNIQFRTKPGEGSRFYFQLEKEYFQKPVTTPNLTFELIRHVLIVDDNIHNRKILTKILSVYGIRSETADSVESA